MSVQSLVDKLSQLWPSHRIEDITLNSTARCLQSPVDKLPIGTTTDPMRSLRSLMHSLHTGKRSPSHTEAEPLVTTIKHS